MTKETYRTARLDEQVLNCGCGRHYTLSEFKDLAYRGIQKMPDDDFGPPYLEFRDCKCGSTQSLWMDISHMPLIRVREKVVGP
jgi:hypothetical protein